jgi:hypothetical protein
MTELKIESSDLSLSDLYKDFYAVPDFQREYVWETENVEKLLNGRPTQNANVFCMMNAASRSHEPAVA